MALALEWDLSKLLPSLGPAVVEAAVKDLESHVAALETWRPRLDGLQNPADVERLFNELGRFHEAAARVSSRGSLAFSTDTQDEQARAFLQRVENLDAEWSNRLRFITHWWKHLPENRAAALTPRDPELAHFARRVRVFTPYTLTEEQERVVSYKDVTGASARDKIREIVSSRMTFTSPVTGKDVTLSELVRGAYHPEPEKREATYSELWRVWEKEEAVLSTLYQNVVLDWHNEQVKLRGYAGAIAPRNLGNDVPDDVVATLLDVCHGRRELFQRYFQWKGRRLGLARMNRFHIYAPLELEQANVPYDTAVGTVLDVWQRFDADTARRAKRVFDERHVDVMPRQRKRSGAYCATINTRMTPYLFLNHTGDTQSLRTLAHELGHAVHSLLAEDRNALVSQPGLPMAETASVFSEMLLHDHLMRTLEGEARTAHLSDKLGEIYATVMRQAYFCRFELAAHAKVLEGATTPELHTLYLENLRDQFGPIAVPDEFRLEWTYIPHIYATPFYVYAYSFGMLLSLALYGMYRDEGSAFIPKYKAVLAAGGSRSPRELLLDTVGVDIAERAFWERGFGVIDGMVRELGA